MTRYSAELKEQMVRKMMPPNNQSVATIHRETGISSPSLYAWKRHFQEKGYVVPAKTSPLDGWDNKAKLAAVIEVYEQAKAKHPDRWRGRAVRDWAPVGTVLLNPDRESPTAAESDRLAA